MIMEQGLTDGIHLTPTTAYRISESGPGFPYLEICLSIMVQKPGTRRKVHRYQLKELYHDSVQTDIPVQMGILSQTCWYY